MNVAAKENITQQKPRVSVFIPSYNHAPFIERCLKSIIKQTHLPSELLVIDDGSKDNSVEIIERVLKDCPIPCELIARENKGLCATLNEGIERTSGDYFAYIGSDDIWLPEFINERVKLLESRPNAVLGYGHAYLIDEQDKIIDCSSNWLNSNYPDGDATQMLCRGIAPISSSVFYRRSALEKRRWNENAKLEDYELYLQLAHDGDFALDTKVLSAWRMHGYNTSRDLTLMLNEVLEAQTRVSNLVGWDEKKLSLIQKQTRFFFVEYFVRKGYKSEAWNLFFGNLSGAPSLTSIARITLRLLIPQTALQIRRKFVQKKNTERYGVVKV